MSAGTPEGPWKVIKYFKELARGHALLEERTEVNSSDLALVAHTALSSLPGHLRPMVAELRRAGTLDTARCRMTSASTVPYR